MKLSSPVIARAVALCLGLSACNGSGIVATDGGGVDASPGTGGATGGSGGKTGTGGSIGSGGTTGTGGAAGAGGIAGSGGLTGSGGAVGTGGVAGSGGSGSGGLVGSGGKVGSGGSGSGGSGSGGLVGSGGKVGSGGSGSGGSGSGSGGSGSGGSGSGGSTVTSVCGVNPGLATGVLQMENLCRGLVAVRSGSNNYLSWRLMGYEPDATTFNVYRNGTKVNASPITVANGSNYTDTGAPATATYTVRAVIAGVEQGDSSVSRTNTGPTPTWAQNYLTIPLSIPPGGTTDRTASGQTDAAYTYAANDGSPGDLDGDGQYEIVLKWDPTNAKDNSQSGFTGNVILDAYTLGGTRLWRIDLGRNIRAGAHYTQFVVYDFDGDGKAEVAMKTAPGTKDGTGAYLRLGPAASDNDSTDYRDANGYILTGPEYLTVFNGQTGAEMATVNFEVARGTVSSWGDGYGNRVDRFLASAAFVSDTGVATTTSGRPAILMARGYYTRETITAWAWRNGQLTRLWTSDSNPANSVSKTSAFGEGAHSMAVADVDGDLAQEIVYGAATIDSNGAFKCATGFAHGDALHVGDLVPSRAGLEVFMPHESTTGPSYDVRDANTCQIIVQGPTTGADTGRGVADDISSAVAGAELWTNSTTGILSATNGASVGTASPPWCNFLVWWDGDESRELENNIGVWKYDTAATLFSCTACASNNGSKSTPVLTADLFGDWREEIVWRTSDNTALRIYTTTAPTIRRIYTLMHDPQYRMQVTSEQTAYNQPPHTSFHIGNGMAVPPKPNISIR